MKRWKGKRQQAVFVDGVRQATTISGKAKSPCPDWWEISILNPNAKERTGYPTQKPLALLRRIIRASSNPGDMILDPFCGCATTCVAAQDEGRQWVGIDISEKAAELVQTRMRDELGMMFQGVHRTDIPTRTDLGKLPPYRTHAPGALRVTGGLLRGLQHTFRAAQSGDGPYHRPPKGRDRPYQ